MELSISEIKRGARESLKGNWGQVIQLTLLVLLISTILPLIIEIFLAGGFTNWLYQGYSPSGDIFNIVFSLAIIPFTVAVYWFYLSFIRKNKPEITFVFEVYKDMGKVLKLIGTSILMGIFVLLWSLLLIIPGIIKALSYSQTYYILRDQPELSVLEAITESKNRMKGYKWKYFLLNLSFIGWFILSIFTLFVGLLWLIPYLTATQATFYNEIIYNKQNRELE